MLLESTVSNEANKVVASSTQLLTYINSSLEIISRFRDQRDSSKGPEQRYLYYTTAFGEKRKWEEWETPYVRCHSCEMGKIKIKNSNLNLRLTSSYY